MDKITAKFSTCALAVLTLLSATVASAQDTRWFRVELLVFANDALAQSPGAASAEQWDATPTLAYPPASRFLVDPAQVAGNAAEFEGDSLLDEYGRQIITILTQSPGGAGTLSGQAPVPPAPVASQPVTAAPSPTPAPLSPVYSDPALAAAQPALATTQSALPRPFVVLPQTYQEFRGKAGSMQKSGHYSILFHQSWVQPVGAEANSLPIVLDHSGDSQQWPRLQGNIKLYLARYLHLETNLWLNTAGNYLPGTWRMPAPPFGPPSLIIEEEQQVDLVSAIDGMAAEPGPADAAAAVAVASSGGVAIAEGTPAEGAVETVEAVGPIYPYRHAVLLQQTRRMRSNEVHYIDHPMLGAIVKFTPVTAEELAAIARDQSVSLAGDALSQ